MERQRLSLVQHLLVLVALLVNLWVIGALVEAWAGHMARAAFEVVLILGYLVLIVGLWTPFRRDDSSDERER